MNFWSGNLESCLSSIPSNGKMIRYVLVAREYNKVFQYNYLDVGSLKDHIDKLPEKKRCLHETILGSRAQKMKIDIDVEVDQITKGKNLKILEDVVSATLKVYEECGYSLSLEKNFLIFDSCGKEKYSYHIIIHGYYVCSDRYAKHLCQQIVEKCKYYGKYIDAGVYKSVQNFRLLGCHKTGSTRTKIFCPTWTYKKKEVVTYIPKRCDSGLYIFMSSLVSSLTDCKSMKITIPEKETAKYSDEKDVLLLDMDYYQSTVDDYAGQGVFGVCYKRGELILSRKIPALCPTCNVIHDRDNATFKITSKGNLIFRCRKGTWAIVGKVGSLLSEELTENQEGVSENVSKIEKIKKGFSDIEDVFL